MVEVEDDVSEVGVEPEEVEDNARVSEDGWRAVDELGTEDKDEEGPEDKEFEFWGMVCETAGEDADGVGLMTTGTGEELPVRSWRLCNQYRFSSAS